ncbi:CLUMA_CG011870, isoform A [Clunio marinus]|uniref:CLUMA_CG011870, isoform A n=1 Tax=Clunio marinus TaxID=568069 RepID=A0A1J1IFI1_9DIPT|nr:CLUMA_CG011870, isoform A [Clunio marinus]
MVRKLFFKLSNNPLDGTAIVLNFNYLDNKDKFVRNGRKRIETVFKSEDLERLLFIYPHFFT